MTTTQKLKLTETIAVAKEIKDKNKMPFVTIWKTGKSFGFNFEKKELGFSFTEYGVKSTVISIL